MHASSTCCGGVNSSRQSDRPARRPVQGAKRRLRLFLGARWLGSDELRGRGAERDHTSHPVGIKIRAPRLQEMLDFGHQRMDVRVLRREPIEALSECEHRCPSRGRRTAPQLAAGARPLRGPARAPEARHGGHAGHHRAARERAGPAAYRGDCEAAPVTRHVRGRRLTRSGRPGLVPPPNRHCRLQRPPPVFRCHLACEIASRDSRTGASPRRRDCLRLDEGADRTG